MSLACSGGSAAAHAAGSPARGKVANGLHLAAAPTFAVMALLTGLLGGGLPDPLCSTAARRRWAEWSRCIC